MRRKFVFLSLAVIVLALFNSSWAQFPCNPGDSAATCCGADSGYSGYSWDLGSCDTLHVEPWAHTDTCFITESDTICINNPGEYFPCFLYVSLFVTHDSNTFYWEGGDRRTQDSTSAFVIPLSFWHDLVGGGEVIFPTSNDLNNNIMLPSHASFPKSIFRHIEDEEGDTIYNRFALMTGPPEWLPQWDIYQNLDTLATAGDSGHFFLALIAHSGNGARRWWEGSRVLLATLTFTVSDSMNVCMDSTFWSPGSRLAFTRYDAKNYVPRDNMPMCTWIGPPRIEVTSPNGGENWCAGSAHLITWTAPEFTDVKIEYSTSGGLMWETIIDSTPNDGEYMWNIPPDLSTSIMCRVRVSDLDGNPSGMSDDNFAITGKAVAVTSPDGGEIWAVDSTYDITWSGFCVDSVSIEYSINGGADWDTIVSNTLSDGSYSWQVPDTPSDSCWVRICDIGGTPCDTSDGNFSIIVPSVTVTSPNGGENWCAGTSQLITWTEQLLTNVKIEYSQTGDPPWETIVASTPSDGEYTWDIPPDSFFSSTCKVKISDLDDDPTDTSDSAFTIFLSGDANADMLIDVADIVYLINYLFVGGPAPIPPEAGDVNLDSKIDSADIVYLINYIFLSGPAPLC